MASTAALLYRRVLRLHRQKLPAVQRAIWDEYVKKEFRAHQSLPDDSEFQRPFSPRKIVVFLVSSEKGEDLNTPKENPKKCQFCGLSPSEIHRFW